MPKITPFLWFDSQAEEAAKFYVSVFPNSKITKISHYPPGGPRPAGTVMTVEFELNGHAYTALNGGPMFTFNESVSFVIHCKTQQEVDHYWEKLSAGGEKSQCGWLTDKYGLSWQVTPDVLLELTTGPDRERANRVFQRMLTMSKLDIAALESA